MAQDDLFGALQPGSFDGIVIPVVRVQVRDGSGAVLHRFPYRDGVDIEYTGAEPLTGTISAAFFNGLEEGGKNVLWPNGLQTLRQRLREQRSGPLVIPTHGTLPLAWLRISETYTPEARDGAYVELSFVEDSSSDNDGSATLTPVGALASSGFAADAALSALSIPVDLKLPGTDGQTLSSFTGAINNFTSALDNYQDDLARPLRQAGALVRAIDNLLRTANALSDPKNWAATSALRDLRANVTSCLKTLAPAKRKTTFVTTAVTSVAGVAAATGNSVSAILSLNTVPDFNRIPRGTALTVFAR